MIYFISGRAQTGKSTEVLKRIKESVKKGEEPVLILPEQFSFEGEKAVLDTLGDKDASMVSVLSFTRLFDTVGRIKGGICGKVLDKADKLILINRAIEQVSDNLILWKKYVNSESLAENLLKSIEEFKTNAVGTDSLKECLDCGLSGKLSDKIHDISLIYDAYTMLLGTNFIDPLDNADKLYYMLEDCDYFKNRPVFFDGFKNFTGQQFKIISRIISSARDVTFTFIDDKNDLREFCLTANIRKTKRGIQNICNSFNKDVQNIYLTENYFENKDLEALEEFLFWGKTDKKAENGGITVCKAESIYDEAEYVARNIRRIIREKSACYKDFLIVSRNSFDYENVLSSACEKNDVKCFIDKKIPLSSFPVSVSVLSATDYLKKPTLQNMLKFHKSGIGILSREELSDLENYAYIWSLEGKDFKREWNMNPNGLTENKPEDMAQRLNYINDLRKKAVIPLLKFKEEFKGTPKERCKAIVKLLEDNNVGESFARLKENYENAQRYAFADGLEQSYGAFMSVLDSMVKCFPDVPIPQDKFCNALRISVKSRELGVTPQTLDEAVFGEADRLRQERPKYVFIMGANQGIFPRFIKSSGLFTNSEISELKTKGLGISDRTLDFAVDEELLVYVNLCLASKGVFISYTSEMPNGASAAASSFVSDLVKNLSLKTEPEPDVLNENNLPETEEGTFFEYLRRFFDVKSRVTIENIFSDSGKSERIISAGNSNPFENSTVSADTVNKIFGNTLNISPTSFDRYGRCRFSFFLNDMLKAKRLYPADFNVMQKGTLVHYVLQRIIETNGKGVALLSREEISRNVDTFIKEYLDGISGYRETETERLKYIVSLMSRTLKFVVEKIALEFAQSDFEPVKCELGIGGKDGEIPPIDIDLDDGKRIKLNGKVDRVDKFEGYVRIVDYKTGTKSFKLPDILVGQNMQMLLYLYAVVNSGKFGNTAGGILYMNAAREKKNDLSKCKMNGLIPADSGLIYAMDKNNKSEFIPRYNEEKPSDTYLSPEDFEKVFLFAGEKLKKIGESIYKGKIDANPVNGIESEACKYCDFYAVCRISEDKIKNVPKIPNSKVMEIIGKGDDENVL